MNIIDRFRQIDLRQIHTILKRICLYGSYRKRNRNLLKIHTIGKGICRNIRQCTVQLHIGQIWVPPEGISFDLLYGRWKGKSLLLIAGKKCIDDLLFIVINDSVTVA